MVKKTQLKIYTKSGRAKSGKRQLSSLYFPGRLNSTLAIPGILLLIVLLLLVFRFSHQQNNSSINGHTRNSIITGTPVTPYPEYTYTNTKYNYSMILPPQPSNALPLVFVSADDPKVDPSSLCCLVIIRKGEPNKRLFTIVVNDSTGFDWTTSRFTASNGGSNPFIDEQYRKGLISKEGYQQFHDSVLKKITFQNHSAITFENQMFKEVVVSLKDKDMWLTINKQEPLSNQIFSTFKFNN